MRGRRVRVSFGVGPAKDVERIYQLLSIFGKNRQIYEDEGSHHQEVVPLEKQPIARILAKAFLQIQE